MKNPALEDGKSQNGKSPLYKLGSPLQKRLYGNPNPVEGVGTTHSLCWDCPRSGEWELFLQSRASGPKSG